MHVDACTLQNKKEKTTPMSPRRRSPEPPEPEEVRRADFGSYLLTPRDKAGLLFTGEQKYARYDTLGQRFAEGYTPATNVLPLGLRRTREQKEADEAQAKEAAFNGLTSENSETSDVRPKRGGYRGIIPWPSDYRKRIHAVGSIVDRWEKKMGFAKTWRPALDQPKWVTLTEAGLRYLGLPYEEVDWPDADTEYELEHYHHISMVRLYLARRRTEHIPEHHWICERELDLLDMPRKLAGEDVPTRPDGILEVTKDGTIELATGDIVPIRRGQRIAVEVELSRKNFQRYERVVFPSHLEHFAAVWYFCKVPDAYNAVVTARRDRLKTDEQRARISIRKLEYD